MLLMGARTSWLPDVDLRQLVERVVEEEVLHSPRPRRVLLVPPDHTRRRSRAGEITALAFARLETLGCDTHVLPATGTHRPVSQGEIAGLYGGVPADRFLEHRWREDLVGLGEVPSADVRELSRGRMRRSIPVSVSRHLLDGWDLVISIGQVVPHEVIGMANYTKNLVIGLGGADTINTTHYLSALCGIETIMGRTWTPVRRVVDTAFRRFLEPRLRVLWILTVVEDTGDGVVHRGLFAGQGMKTGMYVFAQASELAAACTIRTVEPLDRAVCWMDAAEFESTWLANKAIYRTRMAMADGGELIVLAPGVRRFGEHPLFDRLIRAHGYRGTAATRRAVETDRDLAHNLGAAAHLIHGSSEGRFRVVYCTDPDAGGLSREEVEGVGYEWRHLGEEVSRLGVTARTPTGPRLDRSDRPFHFIANPALGLWRSEPSDPGDG